MPYTICSAWPGQDLDSWPVGARVTDGRLWSKNRGRLESILSPWLRILLPTTGPDFRSIQNRLIQRCLMQTRWKRTEQPSVLCVWARDECPVDACLELGAGYASKCPLTMPRKTAYHLNIIVVAIVCFYVSTCHKGTHHITCNKSKTKQMRRVRSF